MRKETGLFRTDSSVHAKKSLTFLVITPHEKVSEATIVMPSSRGAAGAWCGKPAVQYGPVAARGRAVRCEHVRVQRQQLHAFHLCVCTTCMCGESHLWAENKTTHS